MTETLGLKLITTFKDSFISAGSEIKKEFLQVFFNGLSTYIDNYYDKFSTTKTFIYRDEKIKFYDIFYPVALKTNKSKKTIAEIADLKKFFFEKKYITIIGTAGSGKSMLMKHIFLSTVNQFYSIPILVELRNLNNFDGTLVDYISNIISKNKLSRSEKITERILTEGSFIFLFDGYDEIFSDNKNKITKEIEDFVDLYNKNSYIITSRPGANAESLQRFENLYVQPLNKKQINEFINVQFSISDDKESIGKIISVIEKKENKDYAEYLSSPLLLSMFIFTFSNYPEIPKTKSKFYWNVFDTLCTKHDTFTKKGLWLHERKSKLSSDEFENLLRWFSYVSLFNGHYNFSEEYLVDNIKLIKDKLNLKSLVSDIIYDLSVSLSILIQDGTDYTFPHKSLQEYFTASLIKSLNVEQKQTIYKSKFITLEDNSSGGNQNFFKLCYEIDKQNFSKFFLVDNVKEFLSKVDITSEMTITKSICKAFELKLDFYLMNDEQEFLLKGMSYNAFAIDSFLIFFTSDTLLPKFGNPNKATTHIFDYLISISDKAEDYTTALIHLDKSWNKSIEIYIEESGILQDFNKIYHQILENLEKLERELQTESVNTQELLDI